MGRLQVESEYDELYETRSLTLIWRASLGHRLLSISTRQLPIGAEIWLRHDDPRSTVYIQKVVFDTFVGSEEYLAAKRAELESEGWTEERNS